MMSGDGVMSAHQARDVHLECRANGDDPISIMWRKEGKELIAEPGRSSITVIREIQHVTSKFSIYKVSRTFEPEPIRLISHFRQKKATVADTSARRQTLSGNLFIIFIFKSGVGSTAGRWFYFYLIYLKNNSFQGEELNWIESILAHINELDEVSPELVKQSLYCQYLIELSHWVNIIQEGVWQWPNPVVWLVV